MKYDRWFYLWCVLSGGALLLSTFHFAHWNPAFLPGNQLNRWSHFIVFAAVVAVPIAAWHRRSWILLSFIPAMLAIALDSIGLDSLHNIARAQLVPAELFGIAAGVLFGLNIRMMSASKHSSKSATSNPANISLP